MTKRSARHRPPSGRSFGSVVRGVVGALGYDLVRKHYYSAIPDLGTIPADVWTRRSELRGLQLDNDAGLDFVQRELAPYLAEFAAPESVTEDPREFHFGNGFYDRVDAELLYAMVRRFSPPQIVELGSGMSSLVIADARARNDLAASRHVIYDPFPTPRLASTLAQVAELHEVPASEVPISDFERLRSGDLLFVDTTHTVKIASDVNRVILDVLPVLAPGVIVHFHDIFLPWEYPREFLERRRFFWAEQYLLQAFLAFNGEFEVLFSAHGLQREHPREIAELIPGGDGAPASAALWIRRSEAN
ncbi:MAG: class I SAM-dependent methyltransferase [Solirubrobacteraceae bacterium]